jgi:disulfide bond formation protein DsbB
MLGNYILSILTVIGQFSIVAAVFDLVMHKGGRILGVLDHRKLLWMSFIVALTATLGSLYYSEIVGYEPCKLCWFQRILMYPQVVIFGMAIWKKDKHISSYALALSGIGALIAGYHYLLQRGIAPATSCSAVGASVDCSQTFVMEFGYITIPVMAFTGFVLLVLLQYTLNKRMDE